MPRPETTGETPVLEAHDVYKRYDGGVTALAGVSLAVSTGECVALVGESGSGKTTLLRCFNRMVEPSEGRVMMDGEPADALDAITLRRRTGYVQQEGGLMPHWRVRRNAALVPWLAGQPDHRERAAEALERVGLPADTFGGRWPRELSGGQRQRVAIARALASRPRVMLMDEPFGALDAITRSELQQAFDDLRRDLGMTAILVTHDLREAVRLADRVAVLKDGAVEQIAPPGEMVSAPATEYVRRLVAHAGLEARR